MTDNTFIKKSVQVLFEETMINSTNKDGLGLLCESVLAFIDDESHANSTMVYNIFAGLFLRFNNDKLDELIRMMNIFEQKSSGLTEKQRDHYIHSVNVFTLGLAIFSESSRYRNAYSKSNPDDVGCDEPERFIIKWGIASLYHDIGYPIEISYNTIRTFLRELSPGDHFVRPVPCFDNLESLTNLSFVNGETLDCFAILAKSIAEKLNIPYETTIDAIESFQKKMKTTYSVDHGFFSALMIMKILSQPEYSPSVFKTIVLDSARAILLHNYYKHTFMAPPFSLKPLDPESDALSYLLILCDELQEWNRTAYGTKNVNMTYPKSSRILVTENTLHVEFHTTFRRMEPEYAPEKKKQIYDLLNIDAIFDEGIEIVCPCSRSTVLFLEELKQGVQHPGIPVEFTNNLHMIAMMIHDDYIEHMNHTHPEKPAEYGGWDSLANDIKYSNLKQAYGYVEKIESLGLHMAPISEEDAPIEEFDDAEIEALAIMEHDRWVDERKSSGWVYGPVKDGKNRISPFIVPWDALSEEIKELDRRPMRNIIPFLRAFNIGVYN